MYSEDNRQFCTAKTQNGQQCKRSPLKGQSYCWQHLPSARRWIKQITIGGLVVSVLAIIGLAADLIGLGVVEPLNQEAAKPIVSPVAKSTLSALVDITATSSNSTLEVEENPTVQPTPIYISPLDEIWRDDFSNNSSKWDIISELYGGSGYEIGKYFIRLEEDRLFLALWEKPGQIDNGVLQVDVVSPYEDNGYEQGIGFGWHKSWEGSAYAFTINSTGSCAYWEIKDGKGWHLKKQSENVFGYDKQKSFHTLKLYIRNSQAVGYVDDIYCGEYTMTDYQLGFVGLVARPDEADEQGVYYFDEFRIFRIP